ncbi:hypothetical protein [Bombella apis]|uniref:hypothetical protein n=1 Tax=Bombella apis TaxID=1785988 RepID=UPI0024A7DC1F|nr:hypothetical protein [Bombella apis]
MIARSPYKMSLYWEQERQNEKAFFNRIGLPAELLRDARLPVVIGRSNKIKGIDADSAENCVAYFDAVRAIREMALQKLGYVYPSKRGHLEVIRHKELGLEFYIANVDLLQKGRLPRFLSHRGKEVEEFLSINRDHRYNDLRSGDENLFTNSGLPESQPKWRHPPRYSILIDRDGTVWVALILVRNGQLAEVLEYHVACGPVYEDVPTVEAKISHDGEYDDTAQPAGFDVPIKPHDGT